MWKKLYLRLNSVCCAIGGRRLRTNRFKTNFLLASRSTRVGFLCVLFESELWMKNSSVRPMSCIHRTKSRISQKRTSALALLAFPCNSPRKVCSETTVITAENFVYRSNEIIPTSINMYHVDYSSLIRLCTCGIGRNLPSERFNKSRGVHRLESRQPPHRLGVLLLDIKTCST